MTKKVKKSEKDIISRIAWMYFIKGQTQQQISQNLNFSRMKVQRCLVKAKSLGIVEVKIHHSLTTCFEKEAQLIKQFGLIDARVIPAIDNDLQNKEALGKTAAEYLLRKVVNGKMTIGAGWGTTLYQVNKFISPKKNLTSSSVVSLLGGWTQSQGDSPYEVASKLANALGVNCYSIAAPAVVDSIASKKVISSEKNIKRILKMAVNSDIAIIGIGNATADPSASLIKSGYISTDQVKEIRNKGAVGDILFRFYDINGNFIRNNHSNRVIGVELEGLRKIKRIIGVAGGIGKAQAILGGLRGKYFNILITDEAAADEVLILSGQ